MAKLLGKSLFEEAKVLKAIKDSPESIKFTIVGDEIKVEYKTNERYMAGSSKFSYEPISLPLYDVLRQTGKGTPGDLTQEEVRQYAYGKLSKDVLGELGDVTETKIGNTTDITVRIIAGNRVFNASSLNHRNNAFSQIIDMMAESLEPFPATQMHESISESGIDDIIYASAVSRMKFGPRATHHLNILSSLYNLDYLEEYARGREYATGDGNARELAQNSKGYLIASQGLATATSVEDIARAKVDGINKINRLYTEMVRAGICKPFINPMSSNDIFQEVARNWTNYIDLVIKDARRIHDTMAPDEISSFRDIRDIQATSGYWYPEAPWLQYMETSIMVLNPESFKALSSGVSCAIANHYMDGIPIQRDERGEYHVPPVDAERKLAMSQRMRRLGIAPQSRQSGDVQKASAEMERMRRMRSDFRGYSQALDGIQNVRINRGNLRKLQSKMITGLTSVHEGEREIDGELFAATSIGFSRDNQEDAVLLLKDGDIPGFKMMLVADGVGGEERGEDASHYLTNRIKDWFEKLSMEDKARYYANPNLVNPALNEIIKSASREIYSRYNGNGGTTLVCALIGEKSTIISNVGDSRGYAIKDGRLSQVTTDDSIVQQMYEEGKIPTRDAMRFHENANYITQGIGYKNNPVIHSRIMNNDDYDMLIIASDGVTDCLSDKDIAVITQKTDSENPAKRLVQSALRNISSRPSNLPRPWEYSEWIPGGKDNTTAAVFKKRDNEEER